MEKSTICTTCIANKEFICRYDGNDGIIKIYFAPHSIALLKPLEYIFCQKVGFLTGGCILYKLEIPLSHDSMLYEGDELKPLVSGTHTLPVEFYIENYQQGIKYNQIIFKFPELDYFLPSRHLIKEVRENFSIPKTRITIKSFNSKFNSEDLNVSFIIDVIGYFGSNKSSVESESSLSITFKETDDLDFIVHLYFSVRNFFCFIFNRQNIGCRGAKLIKTTPLNTTPNENSIPIRTIRTENLLYFTHKYLEPIEHQDTIKKSPTLNLFDSHIEELFQLFLKTNEEARFEICVNSIHRSFKFRRLINLEQSLQITAAFEYYVRTYLPKISSPETESFFDDMDKLVENYIQTHRGILKKKAKNFKKTLRPKVPLEEQIKKTYYGYSNWSSLESILSEWFGNNIDSLAIEANTWRNDLAHEKRDYTPSIDTIKAIRLIEHINYCIVLRYVKYSDAEIKDIISRILAK